MRSLWVVIPAPLLLGLESQVSLGREVSGDKGRGWLSSARAQSPGASVEAFLHLLIWKRGCVGEGDYPLIPKLRSI